ncbi:MAG: HU family DNA-binding protein [Rhodospirillales bacterium]|nr:HU family DNA-binding protein [Rhodospirillales bacterium]
MNRAELSQLVVERSDLDVLTAIYDADIVFEAVGEALARGDNVTILNFGKFSTRKRSPRTGRNPRTGEIVKIPAATVPAFRAAKALREMVKAGSIS